MTKVKYTVVKVQGVDSWDSHIIRGWDVLCNGEWAQRYRYKASAMESKRWLEANEPYGPVNAIQNQ